MVKTRGKILVVEDNPHHCLALTVLLELEGFEVFCAGDGKEAYARATQELPDVIITDIEMPKVSGVELIQMIRRDAALADVPIVAMSAIEREQLKQVKKMGASAVCQKPIEFDSMLSLVAWAMLNRERRKSKRK